jgi:hypothetical protein
MKLTGIITRSLQADLQVELRDIERAVAAGTRDAGRGLRTGLRRQVTSAGLGQRLENAPRKGTDGRRISLSTSRSTASGRSGSCRSHHGR